MQQEEEKNHMQGKSDRYVSLKEEDKKKEQERIEGGEKVQ